MKHGHILPLEEENIRCNFYEKKIIVEDVVVNMGGIGWIGRVFLGGMMYKAPIMVLKRNRLNL